MTPPYSDARQTADALWWAAWYLADSANRLRPAGPRADRHADELLEWATKCHDLSADIDRALRTQETR